MNPVYCPPNTKANIQRPVFFCWFFSRSSLLLSFILNGLLRLANIFTWIDWIVGIGLLFSINFRFISFWFVSIQFDGGIRWMVASNHQVIKRPSISDTIWQNKISKFLILQCTSIQHHSDIHLTLYWVYHSSTVNTLA